MGRSGLFGESTDDVSPPTEPITPSPEEIASSHDLPLSQYRGYGRFYDRYWSRLFGITVADLDGLEAYIEEEGEAQSLTKLARAVIRSRLDRGPEINSAPAPADAQPDDVGGAGLAVRLWDPVAAWHAGDLVIVPVVVTGRRVPDHTERHHVLTTPCVGEIVQVGGDHVLVSVDDLSAPQVYALGRYDGSESTREGARTLDTLSQAGTSPSDEASLWVDDVLWRFGDVVVGKLRASLGVDRRFVALEGLWFLRAMAKQPRDIQLVSLARAMFADTEDSWTLDELLALVPEDADLQATSDPVSRASRSQPARRMPITSAERFGWAIGLQERPDLVERFGTNSRPRWRLAGPPPMQYVARHAIYEPTSYRILCEPGDALSRPMIQSLWDAGLLRAALERSEEAALSTPPLDAESLRTSSTTAGEDLDAVRTGDGPDGGHSDGRVGSADFPWPRWLRFRRR